MSFAWWHVLLALVPVLPSFWSIWHICNHAFNDQRQKALWLVLAIFVPVLGGIIYIAVGRIKAGAALNKTQR